MKKSETAENKVHVPRFPQILATPLVENLGFASTSRDFLKKIPGKTAETHEQDRQRMLSELPEKNSSPSKNPLWEEERTQELDHSRRVLSQKLKELATRQSPKP